MKLGYARVSTEDQNLELQRGRLSEAGCEMVFEEKISGAARGRRELEKLVSHLRKDDVLVVTRLDRLARSTIELLHIAERIKEKLAGLQSLDEPWADTTSPSGVMIMTVFAGIAPVRAGSHIEPNRRGSKGCDGARRDLRAPKENAARSGRACSPTCPGGQINQRRRQDLQCAPGHHLSLYRAKRLLMTLFCSAQPHDPTSPCSRARPLACSTSIMSKS